MPRYRKRLIKYRNYTPIRLRQDFWKLDHHDPRHSATHIHALKQRGIEDPWNLVWSHLSASYFPTSRDAYVRLAQLHTRLDRGLLIYETCSVNELRKFVRNRYIVADGDAAHMAKNDLIEILEFADQAVTFEGFSELPPELRVQVYEWYMESLKNGVQRFGCMVAQPPVTRVSRLLREEAVPVWEDWKGKN